jgi:uncharacterized membrane protein YkoI
MKNIFLGLLATSTALYSCGQDLPASKVPSVVQNAVQAGFSAAADIEWEKKSNAYEAEFKLDSIEHSVLIDNTGKILSHKSDITEQDIPGPVMASIGRETGYKVDDAEKLEKDGIVYFQVELEARGKKDKKVVYTADGTIAANIKYME